MEQLIEKALQDTEEYGYLHNEDCPVNMEDPDECSCDNMKQIKHIVETQMWNVNKWWCEMAEAHRPYCKPEGNKMLTRMMGKKNRAQQISNKS